VVLKLLVSQSAQTSTGVSYRLNSPAQELALQPEVENCEQAQSNAEKAMVQAEMI